MVDASEEATPDSALSSKRRSYNNEEYAIIFLTLTIYSFMGFALRK